MSAFDLVVIGAGPGGYAAALRAAANGMSVALIEKDDVGGTCLNRGCVPAKAWIAAAETMESVRLFNALAAEPFAYAVDFTKVTGRQRKIVAQFKKSLTALLEKRGVSIVRGEGRFASDDRIAVTGPGGDTNEITFKNAIIATGAVPSQIFHLDPAALLTSESVFELPSLPASMIIVGAGAIGCEIAGVMTRLGVAVTMVELMPRILPMEDHDISAQMAREFKKQKVRLITGVKIESMSFDGANVTATLDDGGDLTAEKAMVSVGRRYLTAGIGLDKAGVRVSEKGAVVTDERMRTSAPNIYAVGEVAGKHMLAYTAYREGAMAADLCAGKPAPLEEAIVPTAIFTIPEIGSVGLTQEEAPGTAKVGTFMFRALARAHATDEIAGFVKIIADGDDDRLLGAHIIGPRATDLIHITSLALARKMTATELGSILFAHPTFAEAIVEAAHDVHGASLHK